ncbi:reverse transcriptase domain-containing protein [Tanacetum coccineum]
MPPKRASTTEAPAMTQDAIRKLVADSVTSALEAQAATNGSANDALSWWNAYAQPMGIEQANQITWTELKRLLTNKYCPRTEIKKMEEELYNLIVKGNDLKPYVRRFQRKPHHSQRLMDQVTKMLQCQVSSDNKKKGLMKKKLQITAPAATTTTATPIIVTIIIDNRKRSKKLVAYVVIHQKTASMRRSPSGVKVQLPSHRTLYW